MNVAAQWIRKKRKGEEWGCWLDKKTLLAERGQVSPRNPFRHPSSSSKSCKIFQATTAHLIVARRSSNRGNGDVLSANLPAFLPEAESQDLVKDWRQSDLLLRLNVADVCEGWRFAARIKLVFLYRSFWGMRCFSRNLVYTIQLCSCCRFHQDIALLSR